MNSFGCKQGSETSTLSVRRHQLVFMEPALSSRGRRLTLDPNRVQNPFCAS